MGARCIFVASQRISLLLFIVLCATREWHPGGLFYHCEAWTHSLLFKSKETFKLAEIQNLEASVQTSYSEFFCDDLQDDLVLRYNLTRLVVDRATGSSLFRLDLYSEGKNGNEFPNIKRSEDTRISLGSEDFLRSTLLSLSSLRRCDWIGQVLEEGCDPPDLVTNLHRQNSSLKALSNDFDIDEWKLDYVKFMDEKLTSTKPTYTMKSLLCAIANEIPCRPSLDPSQAKNRLLIVDAATQGPDSSCCLLRCINLPKGEEKSPLQLKWANRPFQYSSAINYEVAEMIIEILTTLCDKQKSSMGDESNDTAKFFWDPTCGSGTFLTLAMEKGFHVEGQDINPSVANGAVCNLEYMFGEAEVEKFATVQTQDSCNSLRDNESSSSSVKNAVISCVAANLPWGRNSVLYRDEIQRILGSVRSQIEVGTPCAFITRPSDSGKDKGPSFLFESTGFDVLGQAFVPQRNFLLPASKKKKNSGIGNSGSTKDNRNQCVITVALAK